MIKDLYARWMYGWETRLTTRDENRVVRPLEWGFEWVAPFLEAHGFGATVPDPDIVKRPFVAIPLAEIDPDYVHPIERRRLIDIAAKWTSDSGLGARPDVVLG